MFKAISSFISELPTPYTYMYFADWFAVWEGREDRSTSYFANDVVKIIAEIRNRTNVKPV